VGQRQEDEAVIAMTEIVDAALKAKQKQIDVPVNGRI
jgi:hypothetical protein